MLALGVSMSAVPVQAAQQSVATSETVTDQSEEGEETEEYEESDAYVEGEAIILYYNNSLKAASTDNSLLLGPGIEIADSCVFEDAGKLVDSAKSFSLNSTKDDMVISLVRSDQYTTEELIEILEQNSQIASVQPNHKIQALDMDTDPYEQYQWAIENTGQNGGTAGLDVNASHLEGKVDETERVIALVDTGMNYEHEDLKDVVWNNTANIEGLGAHGYDCINDDTDPMDDNGHGSHCSGIMAAAAGNGVGIKGIAQSSNIKIMAFKILDADGAGEEYSSITAYQKIYAAMQAGVNIVAINNSWGQSGSSSTTDRIDEYMELVGKLGALSVCAAGNDGTDNDTGTVKPANSDSDYVISVAASNGKDELADFSNYGKTQVDLAAPGADILSTVITDTFTPSIYANKEELCGTYEDFSDGNLVQTVGQNASGETAQEGDIEYGFYTKTSSSSRPGQTTQSSAEMAVELSSDTYFGNDNGKSLKWTIKNAVQNGNYYLYLPYTSEVSDTAVYDSVMVKATGPSQVSQSWYGETVTEGVLYVLDAKLGSDGAYSKSDYKTINGCYADATGNYWNHFSGSVMSRSTTSEQRVMVFQITASVAGNYTVYIDDMGVSKANVAASRFGKYEYYNGTSMATPYVTGAVAAVANACPGKSALEVKELILDNVRKSDQLSDKVVTGGVLDLEKIESEIVQEPPVEEQITVSEVSLKNGSEIEITGENLLDAVVRINGETVTLKEITESKIVLDADGFLNKKITIEVQKGDCVVKDSYYFAAGEQLTDAGTMKEIAAGGSVITANDCIYYVEESGTVYRSLNGDTFTMEKLEGSYENVSNLQSEERLALESDIIYNSGKLWAVLYGAAGQRLLASYSADEGWTGLASLPDTFANVTNYTIAAYQGRIYLLGGLNESDGGLSKQVVCYNEENQTWEAAGELPEERAFAKALQTGDELVVTLGTNGTEQMPVNLIYNGSEWSCSDAGLQPGNKPDTYEWTKTDGTSEQITYYDAEISLVKGGILYTGCPADGLGDLFYYYTEQDSYQASGYTITGMVDEQDSIYTFTLGNQFYVVYGTDEMKGAYMQVNGAGVSVSCDDAEAVTGAGIYLPGDKITLSIKAEEDTFVKTVQINGENAELAEDGTVTLFAGVEEINVTVEKGYYVTLVQLPEQIQIVQGGQAQLEVALLPENADNTELEWTSADQDAVTVDENGMVTVSLEAEAGTEVMVQAVAKDRGSVTAECKVIVEQKIIEVEELVLETSQLTMTEGEQQKLAVTILPENATDLAVVWESQDESIVTVDEEGNLKALHPGVTTVSVRTKDGKVEAACEVIVEAEPTTEELTTEELTTEEPTTETATETEETTELTTEVTTEITTEITTETTTEDIEVTTEAATEEPSSTEEMTATTEEDMQEGTTETATTEPEVTEEATTEEERIPVVDVVLSKETLTLSEGESETLTAVVIPLNATQSTILWTSDNEEVATVDYKGTVTAKKAGEAVITATTVDGEKTATCKITVNDTEKVAVQYIILEPTSITLKEGETSKIEATIVPSNATNKNLQWSSSDSQVVIVDEEGCVFAKAQGDAWIFAVSEEEKVIASCKVKVEKGESTTEAATTGEPLTEEVTTGEETTREPVTGETTTEEVTTEFVTEEITTEEVTTEFVTEEITTEEVTTESVTGEVTTEEVTTESLTEESTTEESTTQEQQIAVEGITLSETSVNLQVGDKIRLKAIITPENATNQQITWRVTNSKVITVDENGIVTALQEGTSAVFVVTTDGGKIALCNITVKGNSSETPIVPGTTESTTERVTTREPVTEQGTTENTTREPFDEERTTEQATTGAAVTEAVTTEKVTTESITEEVTTEQDTTKEPSTEAPTKEQQIAVDHITLNAKDITLQVGDVFRLKVTIIPENATNQQVTWRSSDEKVATVDENGMVKALREGIVTAIAVSADGGKIAVCNITIKGNTTEVPTTQATTETSVTTESPETVTETGTKPAKVTGLKKKNVKATSVKLTWKKQQKVTGYKVYKYNAKAKKYKLYKTVTKNYITIKKLKRGTTYRFKVRAYKKSGAKTLYGSCSKSVKVKTKK